MATNEATQAADSDTKELMRKSVGVLGTTKVTMFHKRTDIAKEADPNALQSNAGQVEDEFESLYNGDAGERTAVRPPFDLSKLSQLVYENNTLGQCVTAMEINIDGTGYDIVAKEEGAQVDDTAVNKVRELLDEPYPNHSMESIRREIRRDQESTGNGFMEVIRNAQDDIVFLRHVSAQNIRLVRLGEPIPVEKEIRRAGKTIKVKLNVRERTFVQKIGNTFTYFKEFGASRDVNVKNGEWSEANTRLKYNERGTELIHFTINKMPSSPYGVPRWINQLPSVLGSREAEELNLEYFYSGGVPPLMVFLNGGSLTQESKEQFQKLLQGSAKEKLQAAIIESVPTSGSIDSPAKVDAKIERFGSDRTDDSMFEKYDDKCEARVRGAFRLPPMFVGKAQDYNFATAQISYMLAEAQVFGPERQEFDNVMTFLILPELGVPDYKYRSKPMVLKDPENQTDLVKLAADKQVISGEGLVDAINDLGGLALEFDDSEREAPPAVVEDEPNEVSGNASNDPVVDDDAAANVNKSERLGPDQLAALTDEYMRCAGMMGELPPKNYVKSVVDTVKYLHKEDRKILDNMLANKTFVSSEADYQGMAELAGCAHDMVNTDGSH